MWDPERLASIGQVVEATLRIVEKGDRVRTGIEGEPLYGGVESARTGTIRDLVKDANGEVVAVDVHMDDNDAVEQFFGGRVGPSDILELHPDDVDRVRARIWNVGATSADLSNDPVDEVTSRGVAPETDHASFRAMDMSLEHLHARLNDMEENTRKFQEATALTLRHLASDLMRTSMNEPLAFAGSYADRYDLALKETFRGDAERLSWAGTDENSGVSSEANER